MRKTCWRVGLWALVAAIMGTVFTFTTAAPASAAIVGSGGYGLSWLNAFNRAGGLAAIGWAENDVHWWGPGCLQDYGGGTYDAALMSPGCNQTRVYPVVGKSWSYVATTGSPTVGYPLNDSHRWGSGWTQDFDGGSHGWVLLMTGDAVGAPHDVHGLMRDYYITHGGAYGSLGYPTTDEFIWNGLIRQNFQGGSLVLTSAGIAPVPSWPERSTLRATSMSGAVYVVLGGKLYWVINPTQLEVCYGGWTPVRNIPAESMQATFASYPYQGPAPDCLTMREVRAIYWARTQLGNTNYNGWCEKFVELAFGTTGQYSSAAANLNQKRATGQLRSGTYVPAGAVAFFAPSWQNGYYGHIMISIGSGSFISTGPKVFITQINESYFGPYAGWSFVDASWPGR